MLCGVRLALFAALLLAAALPTAAEATTITYTNEFNPTQPLTSRGWCDVNSGGAGNT